MSERDVAREEVVVWKSCCGYREENYRSYSALHRTN